MSRQPLFRIASVHLLLSWPLARGLAQETNAPAAAEPASYVRFITERNIFNPDRRGGVPGETRRPVERPRSTTTPTLTLVGTMDYARGRFAFFDGPAAEYRRTLVTNGVIAGYTVVAIRPSLVRLQPKEGAAIDLKIGTPLRLDGAEPVEAGTSTVSADADKDKPSEDAPPAASGDAAEILRKLMQKREQESK